MRKYPVFCFALVAALMVPLSAHAVNVYWTSTAAAGCLVVPGSPPTVDLSGAGVTYSSGTSSTASINLLCNVVTTDNTNSPGWTTLTLGYSNITASGQVQANITQIKPDGTNVSTFCTTQNPASPTSGTVSCTFGTNTFDFSQFAYVIGITITRTSSTQSPEATYVNVH